MSTNLYAGMIMKKKKLISNKCGMRLLLDTNFIYKIRLTEEDIPTLRAFSLGGNIDDDIEWLIENLKKGVEFELSEE